MFQPQPLLGAFFPKKRAPRADPESFLVQDAAFPSPSEPSAPLRPAPSARLGARQPGGEQLSSPARPGCPRPCCFLTRRRRGEGNAGLVYLGQLAVSAGGGFQATGTLRDTASRGHRVPDARVGPMGPGSASERVVRGRGAGGGLQPGSLPAPEALSAAPVLYPSCPARPYTASPNFQRCCSSNPGYFTQLLVFFFFERLHSNIRGWMGRGESCPA